MFVIKYDFVLTEDVTLGSGCVLEFDGGSISGAYTLTGANTAIKAGLVKIFDTTTTIAGTWNVAEAYPEWFGVADAAEVRSAIQTAVNIANHVVIKGIYDVQNSIYDPNGDMEAQRALIDNNTISDDAITIGGGKTIEITGKVKATSPLTDLFRITGDNTVLCGGGIIEGCGVVNDTNSSDPSEQWAATLIKINGNSNKVCDLRIYNPTTNSIKVSGYNNSITDCIFGGGLTEHGTGTALMAINNDGYMTLVENNKFTSYDGKNVYDALYSAYQTDGTKIPYIFRNNYVEGVLEHAIYAYGRTGGRIESNQIKDCVAIPLQLFCHNNIILNNIIEWSQDSSLYDTTINPNGLVAISTRKGGHIISGNTFKGVTKAAVAIADSSTATILQGDAEDIVITNNIIQIRYGLYSFSSGLSLSRPAGGVMRNVLIDGNTFEGINPNGGVQCSTFAIDIVSDDDGTDIAFENIIISSNHFFNIGQEPVRMIMSGRGTTTDYGFYNISITGNDVREVFPVSAITFMAESMFTISHAKGVNISGNKHIGLGTYSQGYMTYISLKCCDSVVVTGNNFQPHDTSLNAFVRLIESVTNKVINDNIFQYPQKGIATISSGTRYIDCAACCSYNNVTPHVEVALIPLNQAATELQASANRACINAIGKGGFQILCDSNVSEDCIFAWEVLF